MSKNIWIDNLLLFKILKVYSTQYLCVCAEQYKIELDMIVGDVIFMKDTKRPASYRRLGEIRAFNGNKVIVGVMCDIGIGSKSKIEKLHNESLNDGVSEEELENDGALYGGKNMHKKTFKKYVKHRKYRKSRKTKKYY